MNKYGTRELCRDMCPRKPYILFWLCVCTYVSVNICKCYVCMLGMNAKLNNICLLLPYDIPSPLSWPTSPLDIFAPPPHLLYYFLGE